MNVLQCSRLGSMGRHGNAILQVAFLDTYARRFNCEVQAPPWVGSQFFENVKHATMDRKLPEWWEKKHERPGYICGKGPIAPVGDEVVNRDFVGYGQYHTSRYGKEDRWNIQQLFTYREEAEQRMRRPLINLGNRGTSVGIHLRRGDYGRLIYYVTPVSWYLRKLEEIWPDLYDPTLFISSEDPELVKEFKDYDPQTAESLGVVRGDGYEGFNYLKRDKELREPHQLDFFPDFYLLSHCDTLLIPNSTFSFAAALINPDMPEVYRSSLRTESFEPIDVWDADPLQFDYCEDFPHVAGITTPNNPYF